MTFKLLFLPVFMIIWVAHCKQHTKSKHFCNRHVISRCFHKIRVRITIELSRAEHRPSTYSFTFNANIIYLPGRRNLPKELSGGKQIQ